MRRRKHSEALLGRVRYVLCQAEDVLFAYLYGSRARGEGLPASDLDVAVYLRPSGIKQYVRREKELTALFVSHFHTDQVDLRILNAMPLLLKYRILKVGILIHSRNELRRSEFETKVMLKFFDFKPYLDEYTELLLLRIKGTV